MTSRPPPPTPPDIRIAYPAVRLVKADPKPLFHLALGNAALSAFQPLLQYANKHTLFIRHNHLPDPFGPGTVRAFTGGGETSLIVRARFHRLICRLLTSPMRSGRIALLSAKIPSHATSQRAHGRPPRVNTCPSVHGCRVYGHCQDG